MTDALEFAEKAGATVNHGGNSAFFTPSHDFIQMPHLEQFHNENSYSSTLLHELTHWSGAKTRLARDMSGRFGSTAYAKEELIAELGSVFLCSSLGIEIDTQQHAAYLQSWIKGLKEDNQFLFKSAASAQRAHNYLLERVAESAKDQAA
jgi:antirestriction protein ArdC